MEESLETVSPLGVSSNSQDQDWSQWMQWDWDDTGSNTISKSDIDSSDQSPRLSLPTIDKIDFAPSSLPLGANLISPPEGPIPASWARRKNGGAKKPVANNLSGRKRKTSSEDDAGSVGADDDSPPEAKPTSKKRSHNVIEKRYRANLNDKITELRDSVPSLRVLTRENNGGTSAHDDDILTGNKLNKASILSKATEYIRHLELRNTRLEEENRALKIRLRDLDKAVMIEQSASTSVGSASSPDSYSGTIDSLESPPSVFSHTEDLTHSQKESGSSHPPEGLIKVPDYIKRMRAKAPTQGAFAESYIKDDPKPQQHNEHVRRGMTPGSKLFLGTLAGLMVVQTITTNEDSESTEKGLLAVPTNILGDFIATHFTTMRTSFLFWGENSGLWRAWQVRAILNVFLTACLVVGSAFFVFLYLFYARPKSQDDIQKVSAAGVKMTPAEIKRQAWLTSMQRLGVPRHRFFLEWFAVTCRWVEYSACCLLGRRMYSRITGTTEEDEKGRIKTWDIAIDAQLAGGDAEVSKSRLTLTIFASGTLPRNPGRIMLKALHCRILLWRVGEPGSFISKVANNVGRVVATYQWNIARNLNRRLPKNHPDALPSNLAALIELECNDVLLDPIVQRAVNLTWSRPTQEGLDEDEALLDVVADDPAVQTFVDSIAAWWSSHLLQNALLHSFDVGSGGNNVKKSLQRQIDLALKVAPRLSAAHTRAAAIRAVLFEQNRLYDIKSVLTALPSKKHQKSQVSNFLDSSLPMAVREEIAIAVRCAMIAAIIKARTTNDTSFPSHLTIRKAINWLNQLPLDPIELTLVSFAAVYHLLHTVVAYGDLLSSSSASSPSSDFSVSTTKSAPPSLLKDNPSRPSSPSAAQTISNPRRVRSNSTSEPTPQYSRIAGDLMYWARNAYNPAFYGLTSTMVDTVEAECISICKDVGIDLLGATHDQGLAIQSSIRKLIKEEQKHSKGAFVHKRNEDDSRRKSVESTDTGYASDSR